MILSGLMVLTVAFLPLGPIIGHLVDHFGARRVGATSLSLFGASYMSLALSSGSVFQYWLTWVAIAIFGVGATPIVYTQAVSAAFKRHRGLALGITLAGGGIWVTFLKLLGQALIVGVGWRWAFVAIGALPILIAAPAILWGFPKGSEGPIRQVDCRGRDQDIQLGLTFRTAVRGYRFWLLIMAFAPAAFVGSGALPNMENILLSRHVPSADIAGITSLVGVTMIFGRVAGGWLIDRIWAPIVASVILLGVAIGCYLLAQEAVSIKGAIIAVMFMGLSAGVELDLVAFLVAKYMGMRSYATIYGVLYALFFIGAGGGPSLMAWSFDRTNSYSQIMDISVFVMLLSAAAMLGLGRYPMPGGRHSSVGDAGSRPLTFEINTQ